MFTDVFFFCFFKFCDMYVFLNSFYSSGDNKSSLDSDDVQIVKPTETN